MKMLMHYRKGWGREAVVIGHEEDHENRFNLFIGSLLWSDCGSLRSCSELLEAIDQVERSADSGTEECFNGNGWMVAIRKTGVHIIFSLDESKEDTFTIEQVRRAATGWHTLLQMPESPESRVIVDV